MLGEPVRRSLPGEFRDRRVVAGRGVVVEPVVHSGIGMGFIGHADSL